MRVKIKIIFFFGLLNFCIQMVSEGGFFEVSGSPPEVTDLTSEHALEVSDLVGDSPNITERNLTEILRVSDLH
jgi:hypothetical protein